MSHAITRRWKTFICFPFAYKFAILTNFLSYSYKIGRMDYNFSDCLVIDKSSIKTKIVIIFIIIITINISQFSEKKKHSVYYRRSITIIVKCILWENTECRNGEIFAYAWDKLIYINCAFRSNKFTIITTRRSSDEFIKGIARGRISIGNVVTSIQRDAPHALSYSINYRRRLCR